MAPTKNLRATATATNKTTLFPLARKGISKRSQNIQDQNSDLMVTRGKRKAENSPLKNDKIKRSALGNLTNNVNTLNLDEDNKKGGAKLNEITKKTISHVQKKKENVFAQPQPANGQNGIVARPTKVLTRASARNAIVIPTIPEVKPAKKQAPTEATVLKVKEETEIQKPPTRRISNEFNKTEESLYMSALEEVSPMDSMRLSGTFEAKRRSALFSGKPDKAKSELSVDVAENDANRIATPSPIKCPAPEVPDDIVDFDKENWNDPFQVSHYAMDIFKYLQAREAKFVIDDYMDKQTHLSKWMRSLLVDWMVEVQETFELNHETLYLAVKLVDMYLCRIVIHKDKLQLLGAASLFIACKFDERTPPLVDDFLYICDGAYTHNELIKMEMDVLKTIDFDLGIPLSYRFLRRYARCAKVPMPTLTLARYILEFSLMDYATICFSDSKMACAALFMALNMSGKERVWDKTLQFYTGYALADFDFIVLVLNAGLHRKPKDTIKTIRKKYSHKIFHEVAKVPLLSNERLFEGYNHDSLTGESNKMHI